MKDPGVQLSRGESTGLDLTPERCALLQVQRQAITMRCQPVKRRILIGSAEPDLYRRRMRYPIPPAAYWRL